MWQPNFSLKHYNTFGLESIARNYFETADIEELKKAVIDADDLLLLGGGSNVLLPPRLEKEVVRYVNEEIQIVRQDEDYVWVEVSAGKNWHQWVLWALEKGFSGVENLALIPGNVGACPIQNIGAYGVEVRQVIEQVECLDLASLKLQIISNEACQFEYRNSIFKTKWKGKKIVTKVQFRLNKQPLNQLGYGNLAEKVKELFGGKKTYTAKELAQAVIQIREWKLPDPAKVGNAGSFFKNPEIEKKTYECLKQMHPTIPAYKTPKGYKLPAAWLIEKVGMKAVEHFGAATYHKQPLVLVNKDRATYESVVALKKRIQEKVKEQFDIILELEVNIY